MGYWGNKLYENDYTNDVRDNIIDLIKNDLSPQEIYQSLRNTHKLDVEDKTDLVYFWIVVCDVLWDYGRLTSEVLNDAREVLGNQSLVELWVSEFDELKVEKEKIYKRIVDKLNRTQPPIKKVKKVNLYHCDWRNGDAFAYRLESQEAYALGLEGKYIILIKVGQNTWHPGHTIPVVYIKISLDSYLPSSIEDINRMEYIQTGIGIALTPGLVRFKDENGHLCYKKMSNKNDRYPEFRAEIVITSQKSINKKLQYIGNFADFDFPSVEFISDHIESTPFVNWMKFEDVIIEKIKRMKQ